VFITDEKVVEKNCSMDNQKKIADKTQNQMQSLEHEQEDVDDPL
jgi:hypothetical protein